MAIKDVLREELGSSIRMKDRFDAALAALPRGSLVRREIKGNVY